MKDETNDGKKGGLLDGEKHTNGGIKAVVTDSGAPVELEAGETIINAEATKLHWKALDEINQSAGDGVPISKPVGGVAKKGGHIKAQRTYVGEQGGAASGIGKDSLLIAAKYLKEKGIPLESVRAKTGWFVNPHDKGWRFEISDKDFEIKTNFDKHASFVKANPSKKNLGLYLKDVISHPELFKAYPIFENIFVNFVYDTTSKSVASVLIFEVPKIVKLKYNFYGEELNRRPEPDSVRARSRKSVLIHEIQHIIQVREEMGGGSSINGQFREILEEQGVDEKTMDKDRRDFLWSEAVKRNKNSSGEIEAMDSANRMDLTDEERMNTEPLSSVKIDKNYLTVNLEKNIFKTGGSITNTELDKAMSDLHRAEKSQATMKSANAIIRSKKDVQARLEALGLTTDQAAKLQTPDFANRIGFPTYALTNNNQNIKRLQDRVNMLEKKLEGAKAAESGKSESFEFSNYGGGTIDVNYADDRVQIYFTVKSKPEAEAYAKLKRNGWHWSPSNSAWQRKITPQAISNAVYIMGAKKVEHESLALVSVEPKEETSNNSLDYEKMLSNRNFSYVSGYIYKALPKGYTGATHFNVVVFELRKDLVIDIVKAYVKKHIPELDIDKVEVSVYPKTYVLEAKKLYKEGAYLPSNNPAQMVLGNMPQNVKNFMAMEKDMAEGEPEEAIEKLPSIREAFASETPKPNLPAKQYVTVSQSYFSEKGAIGEVLSKPNQFVQEIYFGSDKTGKDLIAKVDNNYITKLTVVPEIVTDGKSLKFVMPKVAVVKEEILLPGTSDDIEKEIKEMDTIEVGKTYQHARFGVVKVIDLSDDKQRATVQTENDGTKELLVKFANLTDIDGKSVGATPLELPEGKSVVTIPETPKVKKPKSPSAKKTIAEQVVEAKDVLSAMKTHTELRNWAISQGFDNRSAFPKFKTALNAIGLDYDEIKTGINKANTAQLESDITYSVTMYCDAKASAGKFGITDEDGNVLWYGNFFPDDDAGEQSRAELAAAKKAVWLASKVKESVGAKAIEFNLIIDAEWLTYQDHGGQKGYALTTLARKHNIKLNVTWISGKQNPADEWTTASGYKKWSDNDLKRLALKIEGKNTEEEGIKILTLSEVYGILKTKTNTELELKENYILAKSKTDVGNKTEAKIRIAANDSDYIEGSIYLYILGVPFEDGVQQPKNNGQQLIVSSFEKLKEIIAQLNIDIKKYTKEIIIKEEEIKKGVTIKTNICKVVKQSEKAILVEFKLSYPPLDYTSVTEAWLPLSMASVSGNEIVVVERFWKTKLAEIQNKNTLYAFNSWTTYEKTYGVGVITEEIHTDQERRGKVFFPISQCTIKGDKLLVPSWLINGKLEEKADSFRHGAYQHVSSINSQFTQLYGDFEPEIVGCDDEIPEQQPGVASEEIIYPNSQNEEELDIDPTYDVAKGIKYKEFFNKYYGQGLKEKFGIKEMSFNDLKLHLTFAKGEGQLDFSRNARPEDYKGTDTWNKLQDVQYFLHNAIGHSDEEVLANLQSPSKHWISNKKLKPEMKASTTLGQTSGGWIIEYADVEPEIIHHLKIEGFMEEEDATEFVKAHRSFAKDQVGLGISALKVAEKMLDKFGKEEETEMKIKPKYVTIKIRSEKSVLPKFTYYNYPDADRKFRDLLDKEQFSDLDYEITFEDGEVLEGVIDSEPRSFFSGVSNPLTRHLNTFWVNLSKSDKAYDKKESVDYAKKLVSKYDLGGVAETGKEDETGFIAPITIENKNELEHYKNILKNIEKHPKYNKKNVETVIAELENKTPQDQKIADVVAELTPTTFSPVMKQYWIDSLQKKLPPHTKSEIEELFKVALSNFKGIAHKYKNQYELNKSIEALLIIKGEKDVYTSDEKNFMRKYSGYGGLDKYGETNKGGLFEYYTPKEIIEKMWGLAKKFGYNNGSVLEPSIATGEFIQYAPKDVRVVGYEINPFSFVICKLLYPTAELFLQPFEKIFIGKDNYSMKGKINSLEQFDLVIGNPPYGDFGTVASRYMTGMGEKDYTKARNYVEYFIRRGLDLVKPGGLLIYIVGSALQGGGKMFLDGDLTPVKEYLSEHCEFLDAYRLPDSVFERTGVTADIICLKKI